MRAYIVFLTKKTKIYALCFFLASLLQVILGSSYNWSTGLLFEGLGSQQPSVFCQGLYFYLATAFATAIQIGFCSYCLNIFSLNVLKDFINQLTEPETLLKNSQFGTRATDDLFQFYRLILQKFSEFCVQLLKLFYFSFLFFSLLYSAGLYSRLPQVVALFFCLLTSSIALFHHTSSLLKDYYLNFENTWVQIRSSFLSYLSNDLDSLNKALFIELHDRGEKTYTYQALFEFLSTMISLLPYFLPLFFLAPYVFDNKLSLGQYMRMASAITFIGHSLSWIAQNIKELSQMWAAKKRIEPLIIKRDISFSH